MRRVVIHLVQLAYAPVFWLTRLVPAKRRLWVFGSWMGHRFDDSPRTIFEKVHAEHPDIRAVWLTKSPELRDDLRAQGYSAELAMTPRGWWLSARAAAGVVNTGTFDLNVRMPPRFVLNTWHGIPMKRLMRDTKGFPAYTPWKRLRFALMPYVRRDLPHDVTAAGAFDAGALKSAFGLQDDQVHVTGLARHDRLAARPLSGAPRRIGYLPTHRAVGRVSMAPILAGLAELDDVLSARDMELLVRLHPYHAAEQAAVELPATASWMATDVELYDALNDIDVLLTDYSSVAFDFLATGRPVILIAPDLAEYLASEDRGSFYRDYEASAPGRICRSWAEVADELEALGRGEDRFAEVRAAQRAAVLEFDDQRSTDRIVALLRDKTGTRGGEA